MTDIYQGSDLTGAVKAACDATELPLTRLQLELEEEGRDQVSVRVAARLDAETEPFADEEKVILVDFLETGEKEIDHPKCVYWDEIKY